MSMDRRFVYYIIAGLSIGVVLGQWLGATKGNAILGIGLGALAGVFLGWFIAAAAFKQ
jgi:hypothetical protein